MQSSTSPLEKGNKYIEQVRVRNHPRESLYFLITIAAIVVASGIALYVVAQRAPVQRALPEALANLVTQLSNARQEIALLQELRIVPSQPTLDQLIGAELTAFANDSVLQPTPGCVIFDETPYLVRFQQSATAVLGWEIKWREGGLDADLSHGVHAAETTAALCEKDAQWRSPGLL